MLEKLLTKYKTSITSLLVQSGTYNVSLSSFIRSQAIHAAAGLFLSILIQLIYQKVSFPILLTGPILGFYIPYFRLKAKVIRRQQEILTHLPNHMDLLVLCIESGLDIFPALRCIIDNQKKTSLT